MTEKDQSETPKPKRIYLGKNQKCFKHSHDVEGHSSHIWSALRYVCAVVVAETKEAAIALLREYGKKSANHQYWPDVTQWHWQCLGVADSKLDTEPLIIALAVASD